MATKNITDIQVLLAYEASRKDRFLGFPETILNKMTGEHYNVCFRAMERACDRGLIEYGVSLRSGWLTEKGTAMLTAHNTPLTGSLPKEI